jgi:CRISPR system Cascade subunit CasD
MSPHHFLLLRLEAPLMSFGGVAVDEHGVTAAFPALSMLTGLVSNALGYDHRDAPLLQRLQERIRLGVRRDRVGEHLVDFQTVDLGQDFLAEAWTTHDAPASRGGGTAKEGTHIRYRHYWADAVFTVALTLEPEREGPDLDHIAHALRLPERPLFLGRKPCIPAAPILAGEIEAECIRDALLAAPLSDRTDAGDLIAWWPVHGEPNPPEGKGRQIAVSDERDWTNQIHAGRRFLWEAPLARPEAHDGQ